MLNALFSTAASAAVYGEFHDPAGPTTEYAIIGALVKGALATRRKWSGNCTQLTLLMKTAYGFDIPESVIRTTLRQTLRGVAIYKGNGHYSFDQKIADQVEKMETSYDITSGLTQELLTRLIQHIGAKQARPLDQEQRKTIHNELYRYLFQQDNTGLYGKQIDEFITASLHVKGFSARITRLRKAAILYEGIRFTPAPTDLARLEHPLAVFLSFEYLLNALEFNGRVLKGIFDELHRLAGEINRVNKKRYAGHSINFYYLQETWQELNQFFDEAGRILQKKKPPLEPGHLNHHAMEMLLAECTTLQDIAEKKAWFGSELEQLGISLYQRSWPKKHAFLVDDPETLAYARTQLLTQFPQQDEAFCVRILHLFSKLNFLREGTLAKKPEEAHAIFLTNQKSILHLACCTGIPFLPYYCPFAIDMDCLINSLWIKLKKGFSQDTGLVVNYDQIVNTHSVLHLYFPSSLTLKYEQRLKDIREGRIPEDEAIRRSLLLRDAPYNEENTTFHKYTLPEAAGPQANPGLFIREIEKLSALLKEQENKIGTLENRLARVLGQQYADAYANALHNYELGRLVHSENKWEEVLANNKKAVWYYLKIMGPAGAGSSCPPQNVRQKRPMH